MKVPPVIVDRRPQFNIFIGYQRDTFVGLNPSSSQYLWLSGGGEGLSIQQIFLNYDEQSCKHEGGEGSGIKALSDNQYRL